MKRVLVVAAVPLAVLATASNAADRGVTIPGKLFDPERLEVLVGDTVTWTNQDASTHTVTADDGSFDSGDVPSDGVFSYTFSRPGRISYHCSIHRFMTGEIDVFALALSGPRDPVPVGGKFTLRGLAAPGGAPVRVERRAADGSFVEEATASLAGDGRFSVALPAVSSADYRAVSGHLASPLVHVGVSPRLTLRVHLAPAQVRVVGSAEPSQPGMTAELQVYSLERFTWFRFARVRFDAHSHVRFAFSPRRKLHLRLVLLRASPGFVGGRSNVVVVRPLRALNRERAAQGCSLCLS